MEKGKDERKIEVGFREDGAPYFEMSTGLQPIDALALAKWLDLVITEEIKEFNNIGPGKVTELFGQLMGQMQTLSEAVMKSHGSLLKITKKLHDGITLMAEQVLGPPPTSEDDS